MVTVVWYFFTIICVIFPDFSSGCVSQIGKDDPDDSIPTTTPMPSEPFTPKNCSAIVKREEWCADPEMDERILKRNTTFKYVVLHTSNSNVNTCQYRCDCHTVVSDMQAYHVDVRKFWDIGYHFIIGGDGGVYEGRGWDFVGWHTKGYNYNADGLGVCIIGRYDLSDPDPEEIYLDTTKNLIECGLKEGFIDKDYQLLAHRDIARGPRCPGDTVYNIIKKWPKFTTKPKIVN